MTPAGGRDREDPTGAAEEASGPPAERKCLQRKGTVKISCDPFQIKERMIEE